jgi:hypothetical protein
MPGGRIRNRNRWRAQASVRTVSMNSFIGSNTRLWNPNDGRYRSYRRIDGLNVASRVFVFLDEREDSINDPNF